MYTSHSVSTVQTVNVTCQTACLYGSRRIENLKWEFFVTAFEKSQICYKGTGPELGQSKKADVLFCNDTVEGKSEKNVTQSS